MAIYAFSEFREGEDRASRIYASAHYPSRQLGNIFFDSEAVPNLKFAEEMPLKLRCFYSVVAFRPSHIFASRDVLGGRPLYYGEDLSFSSFKSYIDVDVREIMPGEIIKFEYTGEIIERKKFSFEDVFRKYEHDLPLEDLLNGIERALLSFKSNIACIAFSGGLDSSLLAAMYDLPLISVTASSREEEWLKKAARMLGKEVEILRVGREEVMDAAKTVRRAIETGDFLQVSIGVPVYLAMQFAKSQGYTEVVFGQGADELFGGYKRYQEMEKYQLENAMIEDLRNIGERNLVRDSKLSYKAEVKLHTPYLSWDVIEAAMNIPAEFKVRRENGRVVRKYALRKIAEGYLPREIAWKEKRAIQYSTGISKILKKYGKGFLHAEQ